MNKKINNFNYTTPGIFSLDFNTYLVDTLEILILIASFF